MNPNPLARNERSLAAYYVFNPTAERLTLECFSDPVARAILETLADMETHGIEVSNLSFSAAIIKRDRLPSGPGEITADVFTSESETWTEAIAATASQAVKDAADLRRLKHGLQVALARAEANETPENILAAIPHHAPPSIEIEVEDERPEPCPIQALDDLIAGKMAREVARVAAVPDALAVAAVLGVASGAIGAGLRLRTWRKATGANLWFLCVARSGTGKDLAMDLAAEPLLAMERERLEAWRLNTVPELETEARIVRAELADLEKQLKAGSNPETKRSIMDAERRRAEIEEALSSEPCLTVADITKESLAVTLSRQPGEAAFALSAEARGIFNVIAGRYSGAGDEDLWLAGFSGGPVKVNRIGRKPVALRCPCISALLMLQPDAFRRAAERPEMAESGFLPRFIPFDCKARPQQAPDRIEEISSEVARSFAARIVELVESYRDNGADAVTIEMEPGALSLLKAYANELASRREADLADLDAFAARWAEIACRLALVLHALEHGAEAARRSVSAITATRAHRLMTWFETEAADLLGDLRESRFRERCTRLKDLLAGAEGGLMTLRDLERRHSFGRREVESILPKIGAGIEKRSSSRGRPSLVARLLKSSLP